MARGESPRDIALVLSRMVHAIGVRTGPHEPVEELAEHASVPVINMLTQRPPPVPGARRPRHAARALRPARGAEARLRGRRQQHGPLAADRRRASRASRWRSRRRPSCRCRRRAGVSPDEAVAGAHALYTDVWVSMGDDDDAERSARAARAVPDRRRRCSPRPRDDAIVLHCLPAHPGEEITEDVLYGERSAVWDQAENRLHAQKALLELLLFRRHDELIALILACLALGSSRRLRRRRRQRQRQLRRRRRRQADQPAPVERRRSAGAAAARACGHDEEHPVQPGHLTVKAGRR